MNNLDKFTWVQTHKELVQYLSKMEGKQKELIEILKKVGTEIGQDEDEEGNKIELEVIDPFSFFCYLYIYGPERRLKKLQQVAEYLNLTIPEGESGLPSVFGVTTRLFPYKRERKGDEIKKLWEFFYSALDQTITDEQFEVILEIKSVGPSRITEALFYVDPEQYFPIDSPTKPYLRDELGIKPSFKSWSEYLDILNQIKKATEKPFYELSYEAWRKRKTQDDVNYWIFQGNPSVFDIEGALISEALNSWRVTAHKDKIKEDDKVILWASGDQRGCYALAEVDSDVFEDSANQNELTYYSEPVEEDPYDQVKLRITHNLAGNPITYEQIQTVEELNDLNVGNQGTNFSARREEFEALRDLAEQVNTDSKWTRLQKTVKKIDNETAIRKFFKSIRYFIDELDLEAGQPNVYCAAVDFYIHLAIGNMYLIYVQIKNGVLELVYHVPRSQLETLKNKYPELDYSDGYKDKSSDTVFVKFDPNEIKIEDVLDATIETGQGLKKKYTKSSYRKIYPEVNNPWIIRVAQDQQLLERLLEGQSPIHKKAGDMISYPLNTIFYGPPGTGKTYSTIKRAVEIVESREILEYDEAKQIFNDNLGETIEFITFHQNYSYEDFIEGLRPDLEGGDQLAFRRITGVFKNLSDKALNNYKESNKEPKELNRKKAFEEALEILKEEVLESDDQVQINETAYFIGVEDDAFRYSADNWTLSGKGFNGFRMKYSDLFQFFENDIKGRRDIKELNGISGLAKQHASYFFKTYEIIKGMMPDTKSISVSTERKNFVLIIDEINRANISRVFGELITLIEPDKRYGRELHIPAKLPSGEEFSVPENLYIIGTMNTADKSIALLDIALRRRFEFEAMYPKNKIEGEVIHDVDVLQKINDRIKKLKGHDFQIGHSYFMKNDITLKQRMNRKVIPLLLEYFMNDEKEVREILTHAGLEIKADAWPLEITGRL